QAEDGIRAFHVTGVQTCALPISEVDVADLRAVEAAHAGGDGIAGCAHVVSFRIGPACGPAHSSRARPAAGTRPPSSLLAASWDRSDERRVGKEPRPRRTTDPATT